MSSEFDCIECGRSIVRFGEDERLPLLCGACMMLPGWFRDPILRERIDADHDGREPALEGAKKLLRWGRG